MTLAIEDNIIEALNYVNYVNSRKSLMKGLIHTFYEALISGLFSKRMLTNSGVNFHSPYISSPLPPPPHTQPSQ